MTEKKQILKYESDLFLNRPPNGILVDYFDVMLSDKPLYVVMIVNEDQRRAVFVEKRNEVDRVVCRVFHDKSDLFVYMEDVSISMKIPPDLIKAWEVDFTYLSNFMIGYNSKLKKEGMPGVNVIASTVWNDKIEPIDIFWTEDLQLFQ